MTIHRRLFTPMCFIFCVFIIGRVSARKRLPLKEERLPRRLRNSTECYFGSKTFEIEEKWSPDLGPPFGIMHCMRCSCDAVTKKRRIFAKVHCVNIKGECPKPTCKFPVIPEGKCCKSCPGSVYKDLEDDIALSKSEMEISSRKTEKYIALLTGNSMKKKVTSKGSARGLFKFLKRNLHFSIYTNSIEKVTSIRFTDQESNIVKEYHVRQNSSSKICGIWHKLPRMYRRLLQKEKMSVQVTTEDYKDGIVSGHITRDVLMDLVLFESVLAPDTTYNKFTFGAGGMAAVKLEGTSAIISILFDGMFTAKDTKNPAPLTVYLEKINGKDNSRAIIANTKKEAVIQKPSQDKNSISIEVKFSVQELKQMARGKLALSVISNFGRKLSGRIIPKQTCDIFQAVLSGYGSQNVTKPKTGAAGLALLELDDSGAIRYSIKIVGLSSTLVELKIKYPGKKRRRVRSGRVLEDALSIYMNGWANGTYTKTTVSDIEKLMRGEFFIQVGSANFRTEIQGKVKRAMQTQSQLHGEVVLLRGNKTSAAGLAWVYVDDECRFSYDASVSGLSLKRTRHGHGDRAFVDERHILELNAFPQRSHLKRKRIVLQKFNGVHASSIKSSLNLITLFGINQGTAYLKLTSKYYKLQNAKKGKPQPDLVVELKGKIIQVKVPKHCLPSGNLQDPMFMRRNGVHTQAEQESNHIDGDRETQCRYKGLYFKDGSQWKASHRPCQRCFCQRTVVKCHFVECPKLSCKKQVTLPTECCPMCEENLPNKGSEEAAKECFVPGADTYHTAGTSWIPYLPPGGFSKCAVCHCNATTLKVKCDHTPCPPLKCSESQAYRERPDSCCKKCPEPKVYQVTETAADESFVKSKSEKPENSDKNEILNNGGCMVRGSVYKYGDLWNPSVTSHGKIKEVCCYCKNGNSRCFRKNCTSGVMRTLKKTCSGKNSSQCVRFMKKIRSDRRKPKRKSRGK